VSVPHSAEIKTAADVAWSDGRLFDGYILFIAAPPALGAGVYPQIALKGEQPKLRLPTHHQIWIKDGVVESIGRVTRTDWIQPTATKYCSFWYDVNDVLISTGASLIAVAAAELTVTPPTLTAPTAAGACPVPEADTAGAVTNTISTVPTREDITGTKDGANTAFTISTAGSLVFIYFNGQLLTPGTDYIISGTSVTAVSPFIPDADDDWEALIFA
jgi:hypothetical protein